MLRRGLIAVYDNKRATHIQAVYLLTLPLTTSFRLNVDKFWQTNIPWAYPGLDWKLFSLATGGLFSNWWTVQQSDSPVFQLIVSPLRFSAP